MTKYKLESSITINSMNEPKEFMAKLQNLLKKYIVNADGEIKLLEVENTSKLLYTTTVN